MNITESEDQAQRLIFDWARWQQGQIPSKAMYHAANEGKRAPAGGRIGTAGNQDRGKCFSSFLG